MRQAASHWFSVKGFQTDPEKPYCLKDKKEWKKNIILDEVAAYIEQVHLHKYVHHGLSSQAMAFNLMGPLITRNDYAPLAQLLQQKGVDNLRPITSASFEYEDRLVFNEDSAQPTSIDIVLKDNKATPVVFVESKLAEKEFGGCSIFSDGDCNGENPLPNKQQCYLHFIGRRYWDLMEKYGFTSHLQHERQCIFVAHYQFFREILFALEKGGIFVLLSDARSPVFHCEGASVDKGLVPFLLTFVPKQWSHRIIGLSIQELVAEIKKVEKHQDWIGEFERKYGLVAD